MKQKLNILLVIFLLLVAGTFSVSAQITYEQGQYVDTVFNDHVDRTAEDFVIASLLVADPGTVMYSVLGHACIRLQCPTFGMDYCFSYESDVSQKVLSFLAGKLMMGLPAVFWHWRKYWALPYAGILTIWCMAMTAMTL